MHGIYSYLDRIEFHIYLYETNVSQDNLTGNILMTTKRGPGYWVVANNKGDIFAMRKM
jgi:hypothetical protein